MRVLIVEDTEDSRVLLQDFLEGNGYEVFDAANGEEALAIASEQQVDIIISDVLMPVMDGYELCKNLKSNVSTKHIPIVFYTATYTEERDKRLGLSLGASHFLIKPLDMEELLVILNQTATQEKSDIEIDERQFHNQHAEVLGRKLEKKVDELSQQREYSKRLKGQFETVTDSLPVLIAEIDAQGYYKYVNAAYELWYQQPRSSIIGQSVKALAGEQAYVELSTHLAQALQGQKVFYEQQVTSPSGEIRYAQTQYFPEYDNKGNVNGVYSIVTDITEKRQADLEKELLRKRLEHAQKLELIGQVTGGIAHDFNNLLTSVLGFTGLSLAYLEKNRDQTLTDYLKQVERAGTRGKEIVAQLLAFCRGSGYSSSLINLNAELNDIIKLLKPVISSTVPISLVTTEPPINIHANDTQLVQVIMNLCINARDAMKGTGKLKISAHRSTLKRVVCTSCMCEIHGNYAEIMVKDNGPGIPSEVLPRMFEPFYTTKQPGEGTGMGLSMVHGIVHEFGGHIIVESQPGEGACFRIFFPEAADEDELQVEMDDDNTAEKVI
ncbi:MAG: response regulator [Gammaproteobacteria bacterium]|nr:response regulator [Gammaproteobacteria bacterium]